MAGLLNSSQSVFRRPPASEFAGLLVKNLNSQTSLCDPWIRSLGLDPRTLHSYPSPDDSDPQQSYRSTCNGAGGGMERSFPKGQEASGRREGEPRSEEGADHELTPFLLLS